MIEIRGIGVSGEKASGIAYKLEKHDNQYHQTKYLDKGLEKKRLHQILKEAKVQVNQFFQKAKEIDSYTADIFASHELLLTDVELISYIERLIDYGYDLNSALIRTREDMKTHFLSMKSETFRSKVDDINDVFNRLINLELGITLEYVFPKQPFILVCNDILPSIIYRIPSENLKGIITRFGSNCSHGVILARTKNIPVIIRIKNYIDIIHNNDKLIMNGESGTIFLVN